MSGEDIRNGGRYAREVKILHEVLRTPDRPQGAPPPAVDQPPILEAYLGRVFEGITVVAPDGRIRLFSSGLEHITGYRASEVEGVLELMHALAPDSSTGARQIQLFLEGTQQQESAEQLIEIVNKRGEHRWLRGRLYRVNEDTLIHVLDITAIHKLRATTAHNAEHYEALLSNLGIGIFSLDDPAAGRVAYLNAAGRRIMGVPQDTPLEELSGFMVYEHPEDRVKLLMALMSDGFIRSRTVRSETRLLRIDTRKPVPVRITSTATYDAEGRMTRLDGAIEDMSEQLAFEAERAEHALVVDKLFNDTAVGVAIGTLDGRFLAVNPAFCSMVGYAEEELLGHESDQVTHPEDQGRTVQLTRETIAKGRLSFRMRKRYVHKTGRIIPAEAFFAGVQDGTGRLIAGIALVEPLTSEG
jgi:PAS domain S-box-containing protein